MGTAEPKPSLSVADYLEGERDTATRHEYIAGLVYAMAGASDRHNRISLNLAARFNTHLDGSRCEVFMADMKIRVAEDVFYYPDVVVTCDDPPVDSYFRTHPVLVVEVLSPTTERTDRHEKLVAYRSVPSIREYALVSRDERRIELHRRTDDGMWIVENHTNPEEKVVFPSIGATLTVAEIYRNVRE